MLTWAGMTTAHAAPSAADAARERFVERIGLLAQGDGMPRIAGRLMALMVLEGGPLSFGELAERLRISRGSVSSNARLLEGMGIIERVTRPGERGDFFQMAPDPYARLLDGVAQRARRGREAALETRDALQAEGADRATRDRLDALARFYGAVSDAVGDLHGTLP